MEIDERSNFSLIQRLALLLHSFLFGRDTDEGADQHDYEWQKQKIANVIFLLQIVRSLVSGPDISQSNTHAAQKAIAQAGRCFLFFYCFTYFARELLTVFVHLID